MALLPKAKFPWGSLVRIRATFTQRDIDTDEFEPVDPAEVFAQIKDPAGDVTDYFTDTGEIQIVNSAVGSYHLDIPVEEPGQWHWRFFSTGNAQASHEGAFQVLATEFDPST